MGAGIRHPGDGLRGRGREFLRDDAEICCDSVERSAAFDRVWVLTSDHSGNLPSSEFSRSLDGLPSKESSEFVDGIILFDELSR